MARQPAPPDWYTPGEFAALIRADVKTITRWDKDGKIPPGMVIRTPGGTRRYSGPWVRALLNGGAR